MGDGVQSCWSGVLLSPSHTPRGLPPRLQIPGLGGVAVTTCALARSGGGGGGGGEMGNE